MRRKQKVVCYNCDSELSLTPSLLQIQDYNYDETVRATYIECPVCGEKMLKQLDSLKTYCEDAPKIVKLTLLQRKHKLSQKQKRRLLRLEKDVNNIRKSLNDIYHDEIYQSLNSEQTGTAHQEPTLGTGTNTDKLGKGIEHEVQLDD